MKNIQTLFLTAFVWLTATAASAALLVYDGFSGYTVDQTVVGQGPTTTGFTGNWSNTGGGLAATVDFVPRSSGLSHGALAGSGGRLEHYRTSGNIDSKGITRGISFTPEAVSGSDVLYLGMLFRYSGGTDVDASVTYFGGSTRDNVFTLDNGNFSVQLAGSNGSNLNLGSVSADTTHLVLLRISDNTTGGGGNDAFYDNVEAWLNPSDLSNLGSADVSGVGIISKFNGGNTDISADELRVGGDLAAGESFSMDEFFVTTDLAAIPEPGTLALVGIALGSLLLFRRRSS